MLAMRCKYKVSQVCLASHEPEVETLRKQDKRQIGQFQVCICRDVARSRGIGSNAVDTGILGARIPQHRRLGYFELGVESFAVLELSRQAFAGGSSALCTYAICKSIDFSWQLRKMVRFRDSRLAS
jgi:hypothetical protein